MNNDNLTLLFQGGLFLIALLTFIIVLIEKIKK
ncbi:MAG: putative holin-like toxin [Bacilli bacterium]